MRKCSVAAVADFFLSLFFFLSSLSNRSATTERASYASAMRRISFFPFFFPFSSFLSGGLGYGEALADGSREVRWCGRGRPPFPLSPFFPFLLPLPFSGEERVFDKAEKVSVKVDE